MADVTILGNEVDRDVWVWIPHGFPTEFHESREDWLKETTSFIRAFAPIDAHDDDCAEIARAILDAGASREDCVVRFWHVPEDRAALSVVSALIWEDSDASRPLSARCLDGFEEGLLQRVREIQHPSYSEAVATVAFAAADGHRDLTVARWMGRMGGVVVVVEAVETDPARVLAMEADLTRLFAALRPVVV